MQGRCEKSNSWNQMNIQFIKSNEHKNVDGRGSFRGEITCAGIGQRSLSFIKVGWKNRESKIWVRQYRMYRETLWNQ